MNRKRFLVGLVVFISCMFTPVFANYVSAPFSNGTVTANSYFTNGHRTGIAASTANTSNIHGKVYATFSGRNVHGVVIGDSFTSQFPPGSRSTYVSYTSDIMNSVHATHIFYGVGTYTIHTSAFR